MNRFTLFACAALCAVALTGCKKADPVAATVNGEVITMDQFNQYLRLKPQVQVIVDPTRLQASSRGGPVPQQPYTGQVVGSLGLQSLSDLVRRTLIKQMAKDENVYPTSAQVDAEIDDRSAQNPNFFNELKSNGFTVDMIRNDLSAELSEFNLTTQGVTVTDQDVSDYIAAHAKEPPFVVPESVEMTWVLVPDDKTRKLADSELKAGGDFLRVATKYSMAPNAAANGYRFLEQSVPRLRAFGPTLFPAVTKIIAADQLSAHGLPQQTDWIKFTEGWAKFSINRKVDEKKVPIDDPMKKRVRRALMVQKGAQGKDIPLRLRQKLKDAKVDIGPDLAYLKDTWDSSVKSLSAAQTPPATTAGTATAGAPK